MMNAAKANRISNNYYCPIKENALKHIENEIYKRAIDGFKWAIWSYKLAMFFDGLTANEKKEIIYELRNAGYDVKDNFFNEELEIRW